MPMHITAVELENFQPAKQPSRIAVKPMTLPFGPNSAGNSVEFDALELPKIFLDPTKVDEKYASDM